MPTKGDIYIGTSGWVYNHWKGPFYPRETTESDFLEYYREHFNTVEINNTFYNLPESKTFKKWYDSVAQGFTFAVKASRYITHMKKLKDPGKSLSRLLKRIDALKDKLGPVLFQLPPKWNVNVDRLRSFLKALPDDKLYTFEFRDKSWFVPGVYEALAERGAAFCIYELNGTTSPREVTADFIYIRLHGPGSAYEGSYTSKQLSAWGEKITNWAREGKSVYCYFDNDQSGYAPQNALGLKQLLQ